MTIRPNSGMTSKEVEFFRDNPTLASDDIIREICRLALIGIEGGEAIAEFLAERDDAIATVQLLTSQHRLQNDHDTKLIEASEAEVSRLREALTKIKEIEPVSLAIAEESGTLFYKLNDAMKIARKALS